MKKPFLPPPNEIKATKMYKERWDSLQELLHSRIPGYNQTKRFHSAFEHVFKLGYYKGLEDQYEKDNEILTAQFSKKNEENDDE